MAKRRKNMSTVYRIVASVLHDRLICYCPLQSGCPTEKEALLPVEEEVPSLWVLVSPVQILLRFREKDVRCTRTPVAERSRFVPIIRRNPNLRSSPQASLTLAVLPVKISNLPLVQDPHNEVFCHFHHHALFHSICRLPNQQSLFAQQRSHR